MNTLRKLGVLGLALVMGLSLLAGCSNTQSGDASTPAPASEPAATEPAAGDPSNEPAGEAPAAGDYGEFTTIEDGKLIMATNAQFPPYELVSDGDGFQGTGFEGIDVEIAYAIAQKLGLELVIDDMDFDGALIAVQQGRADMVIAGLTYSEERDQVMDFTDSYANGVQVVIVPEGSDITTIDDLDGKLIGTQRGTTGWQYTTDDYGEDAVQAYDDGATAVQALLSGQIDCVVIDSAPAQEYVKANPSLSILDTAYADEDYCIAVNEGNSALCNALNAALNELIADGTVQGIIDKYIPAK